jgi:hypothetical protein
VQAELARLRESLERWDAASRWQPPATQTGPLSLISAALERTLMHAAGARTTTGESLRGAGAELTDSLLDARETAEQAERGFVEATALLTTVRELHRLSGELQQALGEPSAETAAPEPIERYRSAALHAIEELVEASGASVSLLAEGMLKVREVSEQVQVVANRATLIALNAVTAGRGGEGSEDLKTLAREVRAATDRVADLARDVELDVSSAGQRMTAVRARVADALESVPAAASPAAQSGDTQHLMERVREMVQDATQKGERLSAAGERASRAAQRLAHRLEEGVTHLETLAHTLAPDAASLTPDPARTLEPGEGGEAPAQGGRLRLLGRDDPATDPETRERGERS